MINCVIDTYILYYYKNSVLWGFTNQLLFQVLIKTNYSIKSGSLV